MTTTKDKLKYLLTNKLDREMLHELLICCDDGSLDQILEDLLPVDAERFPETYTTKEESWTQANQLTPPKAAKRRGKF